MPASLSSSTSGHFVALSICAGSDVRKVGEIVSPGATFREWVQRKITQHSALPCSETTRWVAHYQSALGQAQVSPDVHDVEAAAAMRALGIAVMTITVTNATPEPITDQPPSAVDVLMAKVMPPMKTTRTNELPTILYNQLVKLLEEKFPQARWSRSAIATDAEPFLNSLSLVLSYLQGSAPQLAQKSGKLPASLMPLTEVKVPGKEASSHKKKMIVHHVIDDPRRPADPQNSVPKDVRERFYREYCKLMQCLSQPWAMRPEFKALVDDVSKLVAVITSYYEANSKNTEMQRQRHAATEAEAKPMLQDSTRVIVFGGDGECNPVFQTLWAELENHPPFESVAVDPFLPDRPKERLKFIKMLQDETLKFPSAACVYMHYTGNRGYVSQMWRLAPLSESDLAAAQANAIANAEASLETKYSRAAFKQFTQKYRFLAKDLPPSQLRLVYEELTGTRAADGDSAVLQRLKSLLLSVDDADGLAELTDFRIDNGKAWQFEHFYNATLAYMAEYPASADARRRGPSVLPFARSAAVLLLRAMVTRVQLTKVQGKAREGLGSPGRPSPSLAFPWTLVS